MADNYDIAQKITVFEDGKNKIFVITNHQMYFNKFIILFQ